MLCPDLPLDAPCGVTAYPLPPLRHPAVTLKSAWPQFPTSCHCSTKNSQVIPDPSFSLSSSLAGASCSPSKTNQGSIASHLLHGHRPAPRCHHLSPGPRAPSPERSPLPLPLRTCHPHSTQRGPSESLSAPSSLRLKPGPRKSLQHPARFSALGSNLQGLLAVPCKS